MSEGNSSAERPDGPPLTREQVARFLLRNAERIRAVARRKLALRTRRCFDSEDVLSSTLRRLDTLAAKGEVRPVNEQELWGLVRTVAANDAITKNRLIGRFDALLEEDGEYAAEMLRRIRLCETDEDAAALVHSLAAWLESDSRAIFYLRLRGAGHRAVGDTLGLSEDAARQRWMLIRRRLVYAMEKGNA